jgi:hypothetical protein
LPTGVCAFVIDQIGSRRIDHENLRRSDSSLRRSLMVEAKYTREPSFVVRKILNLSESYRAEQEDQTKSHKYLDEL